jgi:hypothetical protein
LINNNPAPDQSNNPGTRGTPALTRRDSRTSGLNRTLTTTSTHTSKINNRESKATPVNAANDLG